MAKNLTPAQLNQKWLGAMQGASQAYVAGTANPKKNPMQAAAAPEALAAYQAGTAAAVTSGKLAARLNAVPLSTYTNACAKKGAANLAIGAQLAAGKHLQAMQTWAPIYQQASAAAAQIPKVKGNIANAVQRVQAALQVMMNAAAAQAA